jgi:hypothetical protein
MGLRSLRPAHWVRCDGLPLGIGSPRATGAMRCDALRGDALRCDAMRCAERRCAAMRCDAMHCAERRKWCRCCLCLVGMVSARKACRNAARKCLAFQGLVDKRCLVNCRGLFRSGGAPLLALLCASVHWCALRRPILACAPVAARAPARKRGPARLQRRQRGTRVIACARSCVMRENLAPCPL